MNKSTLRERQAALARTAILETLIRHLEAGDADDLAMEDLAVEAGVSRRTLYRYFPTRTDLLEAAGEWIRSELFKLPVEIGPEGIAASFQDAAAKLQRRPRLARALLQTETGRTVRSSYRRDRVAAVRRAVKTEVPHATSEAVERAAAVLSYLCGSNAWTTIQEESALSAVNARAAVAWAIETLIARLREDPDAILKGEV